MNYYIEAENLYTTHQPILEKITKVFGESFIYKFEKTPVMNISDYVYKCKADDFINTYDYEVIF